LQQKRFFDTLADKTMLRKTITQKCTYRFPTYHGISGGGC